MQQRNLTKKSPHAREIIYLVDEGIYNSHGEISPIRNFLRNSFTSAVESLDNFTGSNFSSLLPKKEEFPFGRIFDKTRLSKFNDNDLISLGEAMVDPLPKPTPETNETLNLSDIPSGYTFLGQFIAHDISFDEKGKIFPLNATFEITEVKSKNSPTLELDSLYGRFPGENDQDVFDRDLYAEDHLHFKLGKTIKNVLSSNEKENDLLRINKKAIIADERNDENLATAQTHVAFLRFHNAVIDHLEEKKLTTPDKLFKTAREIVIKHYQGVILNDFLKRIVNEEILSEVTDWAKSDNPKLDWLNNRDPFIPVEFSVAAFRFGHSILKEAYDWNRIFSLPKANGTFIKLFEFTERGGLEGNPQITGGWVIDWRRFFDFSKYNIQTVQINKSRKIHPKIVVNFKQLPEFIVKSGPDLPSQNLAARNLIRGNALLLPTGEEVAAQFSSEKLNGKRLLTKDEITSGEHEAILKTPAFQDKTPLWYYILKEAEVIGGGNRLGTIGSYIVAETLVKLIQISKISIFNNDWNPQFSFVNGKNPRDEIEMADLIKFADSENQPLINPVG